VGEGDGGLSHQVRAPAGGQGHGLLAMAAVLHGTVGVEGSSRE
jgi:hypothetical protein